MAKLKPQHRKFVEAYLVKPVGTEAAIVAGYSEASAQQIASELLQRSDIKAALAEKAAEASAIVVADVDRITRELAAIGFADLRSIFTDDGKLLPPKSWPDEIACCIASIETTREVKRSGIRKVKDPDEGEDMLVDEEEAEIVTKIKLWPKVQALELLARYRKMLDGGNVPTDQRQTFVGMQVIVAPGAQVNVQVNDGGKGER
jgi:phage terminase small subunit